MIDLLAQRVQIVLEILLYIIVLFSKRKPRYSAIRKYVSNSALLHFYFLRLKIYFFSL